MNEEDRMRSQKNQNTAVLPIVSNVYYFSLCQGFVIGSIGLSLTLHNKKTLFLMYIIVVPVFP